LSSVLNVSPIVAFLTKVAPFFCHFICKVERIIDSISFSLRDRLGAVMSRFTAGASVWKFLQGCKKSGLIVSLGIFGKNDCLLSVKSRSSTTPTSINDRETVELRLLM
jgi:hypothetical protein